MSNGARHALGVVAGLILTPLVAAGLLYGAAELSQTFQQRFAVSWAGLGALVAAAVLLAFLTGSRLSPVASLVSGLFLTAAGLLPVAEVTGARPLPPGWPPHPFSLGYLTLGYTGVLLFVGVLLLVASVFPSRWRGRRDLPPGPAGYHDPPERDPYATWPEDATRPMYRE